jgi:hypothetical protein
MRVMIRRLSAVLAIAVSVVLGLPSARADDDSCERNHYILGRVRITAP